MDITNILTTSAKFCNTLENAAEYELDELVNELTSLLPELYLGFSSTESASMEDPEEHYAEYLEEDYYESVRRQLEQVFGEEDMYLETHEEDMKYSDTPIAVSISENLSDIFQPLYNFVSEVRDTDGATLQEAYGACRENFIAYWSQTLCNVMRPLNTLRYHK